MDPETKKLFSTIDSDAAQPSPIKVGPLTQNGVDVIQKNNPFECNNLTTVSTAERESPTTTSASVVNSKNVLTSTESKSGCRNRTFSELSGDSSRVEELRDAVTSRIRELELDNQRIKAEKNNLRNQLRRLRSHFMSVTLTSTPQKACYLLTNDKVVDLHDNDVDVTELARISLADLSSNEFRSSGSSSPDAAEHTFISDGITASLASTPGCTEASKVETAVNISENKIIDGLKDHLIEDFSVEDNSLFVEKESKHESQYGPILPPNPPKVTITRKRFIPSSFRLSYPTSSTSNSSDNYVSIPPRPKVSLENGVTLCSTPKGVYKQCNATNSLELSTCYSISRAFYTELSNKSNVPNHRQRHNSLSFLSSPDGRETLFRSSQENSSQFLTSSSINLLADYKAHQTPDEAPRSSNLASRLSGLVNSLSVYTCVKGKALLVQTQSTQDELGPTDSEDNTSESDMLLSTHRHINPISGRSLGTELYTIESDYSMDYYSPPDEMSVSSATQSEIRSIANVILPDKKVFKSGPLSELSGKFKLWREQWAILTSRCLFFYSAKPKENERPINCVSLSDILSIHRLYQQQSSDRCISFELVTESKKYILSTVSAWETGLWIKVLRKAFKRAKAECIVEQNTSQLLHKGFLQRVKCGFSSKVWCLLLGSYIVYYRSSAELTPTGYRNISSCFLRAAGECSKEINNTRDSSDSDSDTAEIPNRSRTLALWEENKNPVYFVCATDQNFEKWRHYLSLVCAPNTPVDNITLMTNVVNDKYHSSFFYSREIITTPISQTLDPTLLSLAIELFNFLLRISHPFARTDLEIKYEKTRLFQEIARMCYTNPGLKDELFLQLIKQSRSAPKEAKPKRSKLSIFCRSPSKGTEVGGRRLHNDRSALVGMWEGLCLLLPLFLPSPPVLSFLEVYLVSRRDTTTDTGQYAAFCSDALVKVRKNGGRHDIPSFFEVSAISIRHPYTHQQPFSIPIHLPNGTYHVVSFDATTSVDQLCNTMQSTCFSNTSSKEKEENQTRLFCTFGLYVKGDSGIFLFLDPNWKICDVISRFEGSLVDQDSSVNLEEISIELHFRIRGFQLNLFTFLEGTSVLLKSNEECLRLLVHQLHQDVKRGFYLICGTEILDLVALLCQGEYLDYQNIQQKDVTLNRLAHKHFPTGLTDQVEKVMHLKLLLLARWASLCRRNPSDVFMEYLTRLETLCPNHFTTCPFLCRCVNGGDVVATTDWLFLALRFDRLSLLNAMTSVTLKSITLQRIVSFGGQGKSFFLVFSDIENGEEILRKLYFVLTDLSSILELTYTLSDYINMK